MSLATLGLDFNDITAALAHEIKNPAAIAMAHIGLARASIDDTDAVYSHLNYIAHAITDINELVQEMLFASFGDTPDYDIDICEMLTDMLELYQVTWPGISFSIHFGHAELIPFYGKEQFLRLIFSNLIKNAVEAVGESGSISVAVEHAGDFLHVAVCDNGQSVINKSYSNGLGMTICKNLAERMGGEINLNIGENGGCIATLTLCPPLA